MYQLCAVKSLQPNETVFMILDDWMKKYNTSPKSLVTEKVVEPSITISLNSKQRNLIENNDIVKALKKWAKENQKIMIVSSATILIFAASTLILKSPIISLRNQETGNSAILFDQGDTNESGTELTSGIYYVDEEGMIINEEKDTGAFFREAEIDSKGNATISIPGSEMLESAIWKSSAYQFLNKFMQTQLEDGIGESAVVEPSAELSAPLETTSPIEEVIETPNIVETGNGIEIIIPSSVKQTGLCPNYTSYSYFYGRWSKGTMQRVISEEWAAAGMPSANGIATLNDRYLVAVSPKFGKVGDNIDIVLSDGQVIHATIADAKGADATSEWGHVMTASGAVDIIEWEASGTKSEIDLGTWKNVTVAKIIRITEEIQPSDEPIYNETDEIEIANTEETQYIQLYSRIYGLNEEKVYQLISDLTDSFASSLYRDENIIERRNTLCNSKEMAILLCVRNIYHNPEQYGVTREEVKGNILHNSTLSYAAQIEYVSNVLGVDPSLNYAICQASCGFNSPMFLNKNNPTNIMINDTYATFPTKTAGFVEQTVELFEMQLNGENIIENMGLRASAEGDLVSWDKNILEIYNYVSKNYNSIFAVAEGTQVEKQNVYVLS